MAKPRQTIADYMVIALSPALIIALVGSLCFFLIHVFYRGQLQGNVRWVMFWFVIGSVLVSRIAIEQSAQHAIMYGVGLAVATWLWLVRTQPAFWAVGLILLAVIWFSTHKLVWDCTFIDDDQDASGQGLLQKSSSAHSPGRWVIYFSLAALPLFGIGQKLLPGGGLNFLVIYLGAALGLLVTTSFLGLRRYLRQRYLKMPPAIAWAWLKLGIGVGCIVLVGAIFLPRPGANEAWASLRYQLDYRLQQASQYAARFNPPGQGEGRERDQPGGKQGEAPKPAPNQGTQTTSGRGQNQTPGQTNPVRAAAPVEQVARAYNFLRVAVIIIAASLIIGWIIRRRAMLWEMLRSIIQSIVDFFRGLAPIRKPAAKTHVEAGRPRFSSFSEYRNPFFATSDHALPPEQIILYTYEAVQVWAREQGIAALPQETPREFCARLGEDVGELDTHFSELAQLCAYAAYGKTLPASADLEPIRELWQRLPAVTRAAA